MFAGVDDVVGKRQRLGLGERRSEPPPRVSSTRAMAGGCMSSGSSKTGGGPMLNSVAGMMCGGQCSGQNGSNMSCGCNASGSSSQLACAAA